MSYSFSVQGADTDEVEGKVDAELAAVAERMPEHDADIVLAAKTVSEALALLRKPTFGEIVFASVSGSLGWQQPGPKAGDFQSVSLNVIAYLTTPPKSV